MLMLEELKEKSILIKFFEGPASRDNYNYLVSDEKPPEKNTSVKLSKNQIESIKNNFLSSDLVFAGVSHREVIKPLFALNYTKKLGGVSVKEYITFSNNSESCLTDSTFENDLTMLAIVISINYPLIKEIFFPICLKEFTNAECSFSATRNGGLLSIK